MIYYRPTDGDVYNAKIPWRTRTCFVMADMGGGLPRDAERAAAAVRARLELSRFRRVDASSRTTGRDYLIKIWLFAASCPVGIAIVHHAMRAETMANIYYELGLMQAYGQETLVIKVGEIKLPSDFVRTEYVSFDKNFPSQLRQFFRSLNERSVFYAGVGRAVSNNPLLAIDYFRRAYLLTGKKALKKEAQDVFTSMKLEHRAADSVERLMMSF
jgi:hypothetical protein